MIAATYNAGDRVTFHGWDHYPPAGTVGTVRYVMDLVRSEDVETAPFCVRWDTGGEGLYSAQMIEAADRFWSEL